MTYETFYSSIILPSWAPPPWVFGVAWGIIYPLFIAASIYLAYLVAKKRAPAVLFWVLLANWTANLAFTPVQLRLEALWPASLVILVVLGTLGYVQWHVRRYSMLIFWLLVPYLAWGTFATALQLTITATN